MGLFSFFKRGKQLKCDWCGREMEAPVYTKQTNNKKFNLCSAPCKKNFRKSGKGKDVHRPCPTCVLGR